MLNVQPEETEQVFQLQVEVGCHAAPEATVLHRN